MVSSKIPKSLHTGIIKGLSSTKAIISWFFWISIICSFLNTWFLSALPLVCIITSTGIHCEISHCTVIEKYLSFLPVITITFKSVCMSCWTRYTICSIGFSSPVWLFRSESGLSSARVQSRSMSIIFISIKVILRSITVI